MVVVRTNLEFEPPFGAIFYYKYIIFNRISLKYGFICDHIISTRKWFRRLKTQCFNLKLFAVIISLLTQQAFAGSGSFCH